MKQKTVMSIGGSDPSGGAGIQADLKAFNLLGLHGTTTITSITVQNTQQVSSVQPLSIELIEQQIDALMNDFSIQYIKTGLLCNNDITALISEKCKKYSWQLIVDPVLSSTTGNQLSDTKEMTVLKKTLLPLTFCVTPNITEAEALTNQPISSPDDMKKAAVQLKKYGSTYVLIKGGHLEGTQAIDVFYDGKQFYENSLPRIPEKKAHGSGCTLSALMTGYLALQKTPVDAFYQSKYLLWNMINNGFHPGKGVDILNTDPSILKHAPAPLPSADHFSIWHQLNQQIKPILGILPASFIPEVGINIGYALPNAKTKNEICALSGRIINTSEGIDLCGSLRFGGSHHIASIILAAMKHYQDLRSAMNIVYSESNLEFCKDAGLRIASFDRAYQPKKMDSTMEWGTSHALQHSNNIPDIIYDTGSAGKEPMIRIIATEPLHLHQKLCRIIDSKSS